MRILIVAFYYPPEDSWAQVASLRPHSWAKYWSQMGHRVYVLTTHRPESNPESTNPAIIGVRYWPARPTQPVLAKDPGDRPQPAPSLKGKMLAQLRDTRQRLGLGSFLQSSDGWLAPACREALRLHRAVDLDMVISTYGPPANHSIAARLKQQTGLFWVADYRDLWHGNPYVPINAALGRLEDWRERRCVAQADLVTTVSEGLATTLSARLNKPVVTVENGFDLDDLSDIQLHLWGDRKRRLLYTGTLYPGKQTPEPLFAALAQLRADNAAIAESLEVLFYGWNLVSLTAHIKTYQLESLVKVCDPRPRREILALQRSVDALIFLDWQDPAVDGILTGKLYEYMFAGRPILGIGATPTTAAGRMLIELGIGQTLGNDPAAIAAAIAPLLSGQPLPYSPRTDQMQRYTRQALAQRLLREAIAAMHSG
ncbi:glycosyltransferase [Nodosilinea sp. PGN35]|uniref:glycosyltransferase n=1 Tax=Nodosilinea sp. PGN35 TaxID=3020489 RepID=UPI0023B25585|nr:glycosyltransferase [Nodosilinea sp. TSF1-S3]MDF0364669.1 glycosyltransferase [Nodosilinea sp. TSF1-S3]